MKLRAYATVLSVVIVSTMLPIMGAFEGMLEVAGIVLDPQRQPIPGAIVSVVSVGFRNKPTYTDGEGHFLALVPTPVNPSALLEIYWNREIMFRQPLMRLRVEGEPDGSEAGNSLFQVGGVLRLHSIEVGKGRPS